MPRTRPYTDAGIKRVPCAHCGERSAHQWDLRPCALHARRWFGLCTACDITINALVLHFFNAPDAEALMVDYCERAGT